MPGNFKELIREIRKGDENAISSIRENIETIIHHHFSKNNIELDWIANENGLIDKQIFYDNLLESFIKEIELNDIAFDLFIDYKAYIISKSEDRIKSLFNNFYDLIVRKDKKVWLRFDEILKLRVKMWLIKKGILIDTIEALYQDAQTVFIEKIGKGELSFENSRFLKSYLFKIIQLKILELQREKIAAKFTENVENTMDDGDNYDPYLTDIDKEELKQQLFNQLNEREKSILIDVYFNGEKLKDIANKLNMKETNCRVTKLRALAKLEGTAKNMGYN
jgi:RNA polymerase sigma factor (sigma-70 family)